MLKTLENLLVKVNLEASLMKTTLKLFILTIICLISTPLTTVNAATRTDKEVTVRANSTSDAIQDLLDLNKSNKYNLTIHIPAGQYYLNHEMRIYSNTTILADAKAKLLKNHERGAMLANDLSNDKGGYTAASNITIIGGVWDSARVADAPKGTESFRFIHATNITIQKATISNVPEGSHLITFAGVKNGKVDQCTLFGYNGTRPKEAIQIDIVHDDVIVPSMQAQYIHYDDTACDGITITNNEIYNYPRAIGSHTSVKGVFHKNITISHNNLHNLAEVAIKAYNYVGAVISDNTINNVSVGILSYTSISNKEEYYLEALPATKQESLPKTYNITIEGNVIKNIHEYNTGSSLIWGDGIRVMGSQDRPLKGVSVKKNTITDTSLMGIYISDAPESYAGSNTITRTGHNGIYVDKSNHSKVYYNKVYSPGKTGSAYGGIGISASSNSVIYKNTVKNAAKNGIFLYNKSTTCSISSNTIVASADNGISVNLNSDYAKISYNIITGKPTSTLNNRGIFVYDANYATISYNTITKCKQKQEINTNKSVGSKVFKNTIS